MKTLMSTDGREGRKDQVEEKDLERHVSPPPQKKNNKWEKELVWKVKNGRVLALQPERLYKTLKPGETY